MKQQEFLKMLETARTVPNYYNNRFPKNLGYYDGTKYSFDCWNLIKVVLSGWKPTGVVGSYIKPQDLVTGDVDGYTLLKKCKAQSKNFSKLSIPGTYLYLATSPHSGVYIGDKVVEGKTVNVIECTKNSGWKANGVVYSYVDANGRRFNYKGGKQSLAWTDHGLLPWVEYSDIPEPEKYDAEKFRADVRSILGVETNVAAFNKTITISTVWNSHNALVTPLERYFAGLGFYTGEIEANSGKKPCFGNGMKDATRLYQKYIVGSTGKDIDGVITKKAQTWKSLLLG